MTMQGLCKAGYIRTSEAIRHIRTLHNCAGHEGYVYKGYIRPIEGLYMGHKKSKALRAM